MGFIMTSPNKTRAMAKPAPIGGLIALTLTLLLALAPQSGARAHPHAYIDVFVTAVFDEAGQLTALDQRWLFDPAYTAFALFDLREASDANKQQKLEEIMAQNLKELAAFDFFTEVLQGDEVIKTGDAQNGTTTLTGQQIEMRFTLPVTGAADDHAPITYKIFDPTYYIQMRHSLEPDAITIDHPNHPCRHDLVEPSPTTEQIMFAANLGTNATGPAWLGRLFAETVTITCNTD